MLLILRHIKLAGKDALLTPLVKQLTKTALEAEIESHISQDVLAASNNSKNCYYKKIIKGTSEGFFDLETSRDSNITELFNELLNYVSNVVLYQIKIVKSIKKFFSPQDLAESLPY